MQTKINKPLVEKKKSISFIWILPLIILLVLIWTVYESYSKKGTNIQIIFNSAEGLKEGVTPLKYRGLELGKVTKIVIKDLDRVEVNILVKKEASNYVAVEGSKFWIKKPTVTLTKISGLDTLISGYEIEVMPQKNINKKLKSKTKFIGLDSQPNYEYIKNGYYVTLLVRDGDSVNIGMPLFYNSMQIGEVVSKELHDENVYTKAYIYKQYEGLVNESSFFTLNDALKVNFGADGFNLKVSSLYSSLIGGIKVSTPDMKATKITNDKQYLLYTSEDNLEEKVIINIEFYDAKDIAEGTSIMYKGITIGKVTNISLNTNSIKAQAFIYKKYKYLLTNNSEFEINSAEISLDGIKNIGTVLTGKYIDLKYKKGEFKTYFKDKKLLDTQINTDDLELTLKAKNLGSITDKSKIYYKNIEIGKINNITLSKNYNDVIIKIQIYGKYKNIISNNTLFYDMSSKLIDIKNLNLNINYSGINPLLKGAIAVIKDKKKTKLSKKEFKVYSSHQEAYKVKKMRNEGFILKTAFENSFRLEEDMPIFYQNYEIGFINKIDFEEHYSQAELFIYNKYKKYITKYSKFYKKSPVKVDASLNGVLFEIGDISSLLYGSIALDNSSKKHINGYQVYESKDTMQNSTNTINIVFDDVDGIVEQSSKLVYKGITIGKVIDISLGKDQKIVVKVQIDKNYDEFAKEGNQFYLKRSKISVQEVKNLSAAIFAVNIGLVKGKGKRVKSSFNGYNSISDIQDFSRGKIFKVHSLHATSAAVDSPIYYKNVQIGKINKIDLSDDASKVIIDCLIYNKYTNIVRENSNFYDISGFKLKFSIFSGTKIETNTFSSILKGGLMLITPNNYGRKANQNDIFILKKELMDDWEKISPIIK